MRWSKLLAEETEEEALACSGPAAPPWDSQETGCHRGVGFRLAHQNFLPKPTFDCQLPKSQTPREELIGKEYKFYSGAQYLEGRQILIQSHSQVTAWQRSFKGV